MERQEILAKAEAPVLVVLMDESVLSRTVGGAEVMHDQLLHPAELAENDDIIIQIIPLASSACAGFISHFALASLNGGAEVAYVDNQLNGEVIERPDQVAVLRRTFELFRAEALSKQESIALIRR